jgi:hypothetical protein
MQIQCKEIPLNADRRDINDAGRRLAKQSNGGFFIR